MRTNLPNQLVTLNFTAMLSERDEPSESQTVGLLVDVDSGSVTIIGSDGDEMSYDIYMGYHDIDDKFYCSNINYNHDEDEVQDFQKLIHDVDVANSIKKLAAVVLAEFKAIVDVVPEDNNELWNLLQDSVFPKQAK